MGRTSSRSLVARVIISALALISSSSLLAKSPDIDLNGDHKADLLWYNAATGQTSTWLMNGTSAIGAALLLTHPNWKVIQTPDLNADGKADLLWYNSATGQTSVWLMDGTTTIGGALLLTHPDWRVIQTPDLNGDGKADLLWYNAATGQTSVWLMDGTTTIGAALLLTHPDWKVIRVPDLNGDGRADLLWYNFTTGQTSAWLMNGGTTIGSALLLTDPNWEVVQTPDLNGDGKADLVWYNFATGQTSAWLMDGASAAVQQLLLTHPNWKTFPGEITPQQLTCFPGHGNGTDGIQLFDPSNLFAYSTSSSADRAGPVTLTWGAQYSFNANTGPYTGSLRATLWAVNSSFAGGNISGHVIGRFPANFVGPGAFSPTQLRAGGNSYSDINGSVAGVNPPAGKYCVVMTLEEYFGTSCGASTDGYCTVDWLQFSSPAAFN